MNDAAKPFLPYGRQTIEEDDIAAVTAVLRGDWLTTGPTVKAFEAALARRTAARHAVVCHSATAGLHMAILALGIGPGDHVIVPTITFLATANVVRLAGAEVVFADVDPATGLMTATTLEEAIARTRPARVRAAMPVHLAGRLADLRGLNHACAQHGIDMIEDAAHAIGTTYPDGVAGDCRWSRMAVFSFHPVKTIAMGEGGAVTTNDDALQRQLALLRSHGMEREPEHWRQPALAFDRSGRANPWYYEMAAPGFNYRATDIQCALGLSQLAKLDRFAARRRDLVALYGRRLATLAPIVTPMVEPADCQPAWHLYVAQVDFEKCGADRAEVMGRLHASGIGSQVHYIPVHRQPYYRERYGDIDLPGADRYYRRCLTLPLYPAMTDGDVDRVVEALRQALGINH